MRKIEKKSSLKKARKKKTTKARVKTPATESKTRAATASADLFNQVITLTGIPAANIKRELQGILERKNLDIHNLTVDQLRGVVAIYLRQIMGGILDRYSGRHH